MQERCSIIIARVLHNVIATKKKKKKPETAIIGNH